MPLTYDNSIGSSTHVADKGFRRDATVDVLTLQLTNVGATNGMQTYSMSMHGSYASKAKFFTSGFEANERIGYGFPISGRWIPKGSVALHLRRS